MAMTSEQFSNLDHAYDYFNRELFDGKLPDCMITFQRKRGAAGYFAPERYKHRDGDKHAAEIALNPDTFEGCSDLEILSTLVHEQVHAWQERFGKPSRNGYHNREWAAKMLSLGLMPSDTGSEGGKMTGQRCSHYILDGQRFDLVARNLIESGFAVRWFSNRTPSKSAKDKYKYHCWSCGNNAWAKAGVNLVCGDCSELMPLAPEQFKVTD